ncbi:MAG: GAF domain-containing protein [Planctomycetota bacterium]
MTFEPVNADELTREEVYRLIESSMSGLIEAEGGPLLDETAVMATFCSLVKTLHRGAFWVGFYRLVRPDVLLIGPYQGTPGCLEIPLNRGVCGQAAREGRTVIVPDVLEHPDHIACDPRSRSEIVVPYWGSNGELRGVLDIDSDEPNTFDEEDARHLESLLSRFLRF